MWTDIFLANRTAVLAALDRFGRATAELRAAIRAGDRRRLAAVLTRARQVRRRLAPPRARDRTAPKRRRAR
jgi:prephenate dehydrogenase